MRVTILGKRWELVFRRIKDYGRCDAPDKKNKKITVRQSLKGRPLLEVLLHEKGWSVKRSLTTPVSTGRKAPGVRFDGSIATVSLLNGTATFSGESAELLATEYAQWKARSPR